MQFENRHSSRLESILECQTKLYMLEYDKWNSQHDSYLDVLDEA